MSKDSDTFLQAEQSAQDLLETLEQLKKETTSYKNSVEHLNAVREKLVGLIDSTQIIAKDTYEIVKLLKSIGGPELFDRMRGQSEQLDKMKMLAFIALFVSGVSLIGIAFLLAR